MWWLYLWTDVRRISMNLQLVYTRQPDCVVKEALKW